MTTPEPVAPVTVPAESTPPAVEQTVEIVKPAPVQTTLTKSELDFFGGWLKALIERNDYILKELQSHGRYLHNITLAVSVLAILALLGIVFAGCTVIGLF